MVKQLLPPLFRQTFTAVLSILIAPPDTITIPNSQKRNYKDNERTFFSNERRKRIKEMQLKINKEKQEKNITL